MNRADLASINPYSQASNYNDINALQSIKHGNGGSQEERLDAVAQQFESVFVSMMLKGMRDANKVFSEGNMLQSSQTEMYQQMFDSQMAVTLSTSKGLGLADVIKRQLSKGSMPAGAEMESQSLPAAFSVQHYPRQAFPASARAEQFVAALDTIDAQLARSEPAPTTGRPVQVGETQLEPILDVASDTTNTLADPQALDFSSPETFIASLWPYALEVERETGIDARVMLAQSALETGWGKHPILKQNGDASFNMFGIKAHAGWSGDAASITTTEYREGVAIKERAQFRAYGSYAESFRDYANFLKTNERYQAALSQQDDPKQFAQALQQSGYATDPRYGDKIGRILDHYILGRAEYDGVSNNDSEVR